MDRGLEAVIDYCTAFPEGNWGALCCKAHDDAFALGGGVVDFLAANWRLGACVVDAAGPVGLLIGATMAVGTTLFGLPFWIRAKRAKKAPPK